MTPAPITPATITLAPITPAPITPTAIYFIRNNCLIFVAFSAGLPDGQSQKIIIKLLGFFSQSELPHESTDHLCLVNAVVICASPKHWSFVPHQSTGHLCLTKALVICASRRHWTLMPHECTRHLCLT